MTTLTNDEAFKKFIAELDFQDIAHDTESIRQLYWRAWQAATVESENRIAELKANTSQIVQAISRAADAREAGMENEIIALQAHINILREALEAECGGRCNAEYNPCNARQALASTPAQSLTERKEQWEAKLMAECTDPNQ